MFYCIAPGFIELSQIASLDHNSRQFSFSLHLPWFLGLLYFLTLERPNICR